MTTVNYNKSGKLRGDFAAFADLCIYSDTEKSGKSKLTKHGSGKYTKVSMVNIGSIAETFVGKSDLAFTAQLELKVNRLSSVVTAPPELKSTLSFTETVICSQEGPYIKYEMTIQGVSQLPPLLHDAASGLYDMRVAELQRMISMTAPIELKGGLPIPQ